jgi:dTDP-4-amino-4,6-dideoxygalactose transaminase
VPFVNLVAQHRELKAELLQAIGGVLDSAAFILGEQVQEFERRFAQLCGARHAVAVNSGTDALILALRALGIGPGAEVITTPSSFVATAAAIVAVGARPVFVDVGPDYNLDPARVEQAITPATRALLPVHLTGRPTDTDALGQIARQRGLVVVEDAAQAVGAQYRGRPVGCLGNAGCFSLHPLKTLNACGDGGVITTSDDAVAERLRILRNIGLRSRDECVEWSGNSRLDTIQAAILLVKLPHLDAWTRARRAIADYYRKALADVPGVVLPLPDRPHEFSVYHTFMIQAERRDALKRFLLERGIGTAIHYPVPIHRHPAAASWELLPGSFPVAEGQAARFLSLPIWHGLKQAQLDEVVTGIRAFYRA